MSSLLTRHQLCLLGSLFAVLFWTTATGSANPITYSVTADTSSISGTAGSLDINFNPGPFVTQAASLQILSFTSDGSLAAGPELTGDVAGLLPATLTFDNGGGFNDYFSDFTFGSALSFDVSLYGPALDSPNGSATSGSTLAFSLFSDAAGTTPVLTSDLTDGFTFTVDVNLDGTTTVSDYSAQTSIVPLTSTAPEPGPLMLTSVAGSMAFLAHELRRQRTRR